MAVLTIVRHGESRANIQNIWAGHLDHALTVHGMAQAARLGQAFSTVPISAIYTSDLLRAATTAHAVHSQHHQSHLIPYTVSNLLREQNFGDAEGCPWDAGAFNSSTAALAGWDESRQFRMANGAESLHDISLRADLAIRQFIIPHLLSGDEEQHIVLVAHGIFLSELMFALKRSGDKGLRFVKSGSGFTNTGWARFEVSLDPAFLSTLPPPTYPPLHITDLHHVLSSTGVLPPQLHSDVPTPVLRSKVLALNQVEHLEGLVRQKGGIGSSAHDPKQRKIQEFFGGGAAAKVEGETQ